MDRDGWQQLLTAEETKLQFSQGFKFLYGPWSSRAGLEVAFLSLNPGRAPPFAELRTVSDERGNSYRSVNDSFTADTAIPDVRRAGCFTSGSNTDWCRGTFPN